FPRQKKRATCGLVTACGQLMSPIAPIYCNAKRRRMTGWKERGLTGAIQGRGWAVLSGDRLRIPSATFETEHSMGKWRVPLLSAGIAAGLLPGRTEAACCYFAAKDKDILQPAQKVFLTWDPVEKVESFTVQPKFEGNASDFGMVIPTPSKPRLDEMPRDFFKELAVFSLLKKREQPHSRLLQLEEDKKPKAAQGAPKDALGDNAGLSRQSTVKVLEAGVVGNLDYKIIEAGRGGGPDALLKEKKESSQGGRDTPGCYIAKGWAV